MIVRRSSLLEGVQKARGTIVVVDVFRAFTCAPLLFSLGVRSVSLVAAPEEALDMKAREPDLVLTGEVEGIPIEGFDLGNSPSQILRAGRDLLEGKRVVQRTSSGVQGVLAALDRGDEVLLGSYALAGATAEYIRARSPREVCIVAMGWSLKEEAPEDQWCARYLAHLLGAGTYDHNEALREILFHHSAQKFLRGESPHFPPEDPVLCLQRDVYDFALKAVREGDGVVVTQLDG
jgi:2-phosphosulfolactate phosphatase